MIVPSRLGKEMSSTAAERELRHLGIVVMRELAQSLGLDRIHLGDRAVVGGDHRTCSAAPQMLVADLLPVTRRCALARIEAHGHRQLHAVVLEDRGDRLSSLAAEMRMSARSRRSVSSLDLPLGEREHAQTVLNVGVEPRLETRRVDQARAVRRPPERGLVGREELRELVRGRARLRVDQIELELAGPVARSRSLKKAMWRPSGEYTGAVSSACRSVVRGVKVLVARSKR